MDDGYETETAWTERHLLNMHLDFERRASRFTGKQKDMVRCCTQILKLKQSSARVSHYTQRAPQIVYERLMRIQSTNQPLSQ